ncbi:MAG: alpha/beta hydrolase [Bacteroidales bacterium]|nr:alpha/beta hydrolase [Bacteroidales bacterium]
MKKRLYLLLSLVFIFFACTKPKVKTGYIKVPTVSENALSGVCTLLEPASPTKKLYYEECGQGEPLILLHAHAVDCRMWDDVFLKLSKNFRVIRYDLRGYGKSDMPEPGYGFLQADDLKNLMDALGIKKAHLAGLSLGGMTVAEFVALYPARVLSATISSGALSEFPDRTVIPGNILKVYNDTVFALKSQEVENKKKRELDVRKNELKSMMRSFSGEHFRDISEKLDAMIDDWKAWQLLNPETDAFIGWQADSLLVHQKTQPRILLIIGRYDSVDSKKSMQRMAALCPKAKIKIFSESGHFTCMETPDEFMEKMIAFIRQK